TGGGDFEAASSVPATTGPPVPATGGEVETSGETFRRSSIGRR
ncbi:hypothetical protein Tco_1061632, partial [Tanacetum coccineum]